MSNEAEREAAYRLMRNDDVAFTGILEPHMLRSAERARRHGRVIVASDTTEVGFSTPREGLGRINDGELGRGFFLHVALAVTADGRREPLGVVAAREHVRLHGPPEKKFRHTERVAEQDKESARWWEVASQAAKRLAGLHAIHVMDREADNYVLFARLLAEGQSFVIRGKHDRRVLIDGAKDPTLRNELRRLEGRVTRTITINQRKPKPLAARYLPARSVRTAHLEFRSTTVVLRCPKPVPVTDLELPATLQLNVVHVTEPSPPDGYNPIEWTLYTTEPIVTPADIEAVVDAYDTRWVIEEYFKALKTGCALEKRELESLHTILNCLAVLMPMAWSLLRLRTAAREDSDADASTVLSPLQITILQRLSDVRMEIDNPTVKDAYEAIAKLGRHIKNNGPPGWQVMTRGYLELLALTRGASAVLGVADEDYL